MTAGLINSVAYFLSLSWLTGPIFYKELRVSSRRRRNYFLRFAYVALLTVFVAFAWFVTTRGSASTSKVFQISRMSEAGKYIVTTILWFQFITIQLIAIVMLSTAINDEIYHRTLGLLMTTPISSFQIVIGKLFSKLLQLVLLLAISGSNQSGLFHIQPTGTFGHRPNCSCLFSTVHSTTNHLETAAIYISSFYSSQHRTFLY